MCTKVLTKGAFGVNIHLNLTRRGVFMIYTVTFNPAIDYVMRADSIFFGITNRSSAEELHFGGKGINVSVVLGNLGEETTSLGFVGGFTGEYLEKGLQSLGIKTDFVHLVGGITRINVKLKSDEETEINAKGPCITEDELHSLMEKLCKVKDGDTVILAGSIPASLPSDIYEKILESLDGRGVRFVVDAEGELLLKTLKYRPFLIKPNDFELSGIAGRELKSNADIENAARKLKDMGAVNVLVSLGADGAILIDEFGEIHRCSAPKISPVDTVGAGDSMVAGFLSGVKEGYGYALKLGIAAGSATAASAGLAKKEDIFKFFEMI